MMLILLFLGCFVDQVSMMLITLPFFMPLVQRYGIDPIWFGVLFLICMQLGLLTPPFGLLLFTMKGVAPPAITMQQIYGAAMPYVVLSLADAGPDLHLSGDRDLAARRAEPLSPSAGQLRIGEDHLAQCRVVADIAGAAADVAVHRIENARLHLGLRHRRARRGSRRAPAPH